MKWTKRADIAAIERDKAAIIADMTNREVRSELGRDPEQWQTPAPQPEPKGPQHTVTDAQIAALVRAEVATVLGKIGHLDRMVTMIVEETVTSDDILAKAITKLKTEIGSLRADISLLQSLKKSSGNVTTITKDRNAAA